MDKRIIISGSEGFLGRHLCENLMCSDLSGGGYKIVRKIDVANGDDLCDPNTVAELPSFDCFIHLANILYVPDSYLNPERYYRVNYLSTLNAIEACRKNKAQLIYLSSYIYGSPQYLPVDENHPVNPFNPYAQTKVICEKLCEGYHRDFGVPVTVLRPFNIYGAGQKGKLLIPEIVSQIGEGKTTIQLKDPTPRRDFVNVKDVCEAIKACIGTEHGYSVYNICSGRSVSVRELTEIINKQLNNKITFEFAESDRPSEVDETRGSYAKIQQSLGWKPKVDIEQGLREILHEF